MAGQGKTAGDLLLSKRDEVSDVISVAPRDTVLDALELMRRKNVGAVIVLEDGRLVGIFTERDYARNGELAGRSARECSVSEIMTDQAIAFVRPEDSIERCHALMKAYRIRHLPVCEDSSVIGVLSVRDILEEIIAEDEQVIRTLKTDRLMMTTDTGSY